VSKKPGKWRLSRTHATRRRVSIRPPRARRTACLSLGACALTLGLIAAWPARLWAQAAAADAGVAEAGTAEAGTLAPEPLAGADAGVPNKAAPRSTPPRLLKSTPPAFPEDKADSGEHPTVVLKVTVFADGSIGDVVVEHSAGASFDAAASDAVRSWTFAPAQRDGIAIASRVGVAVHFELPELGVEAVTAVSGESIAVPHAHEQAPAKAEPPAQAAHEAEAHYAATARVAAPMRSEERGASDVRIDGELLRAAPVADSGELLKRAPGVVVARVEGDAVGQRIMLRGFDADHGQDIELTVDGVPVNQPSHIHGQGYADLGFVIPEAVRSLRVTEGVYDPRQGDFAVAGTADFELGVEERGIRLSTSYGSFHTFRELAVYAPKDVHPDTFGAVVFKKTSGFGQNRAATSGAAMGQIGFGGERLRTTLHASIYGSRAQTANVLRRDDIDAGNVGFYDVYPLATTEAQSGAAQRAQISARTRFHGEAGENAELLVYGLINNFRLQANYTGFNEVSRTNPSWTGRGDLIEQQNEDRTVGLRGRYRTREFSPFSFLRGLFEVGLSGRFDHIEQTQNLLQAPQNTTWDQRIDATISALDVGGYLDLDSTWFQRAHLRGGVRADLLSYQVSDRLQNFVPAFRQEDYIPGYRRSAAGIAAGPRLSLEVDLVRGLSAIAAYGEGYRSPMALLLDDGEPAPFVKVRSTDLGLHFRAGPNDELDLRAGGYFTHLDSDVAFDPHEGRATSVGPSDRLGASLYARARPWPFLLAALSVTYVHASLRDPPAASAEDPSPPFEKGQLLPYVPPVVLRADLSAQHALATLAEHPLVGRIGAGYSYWSPRPLPFSERAAPVSVLDAELMLRYRMFALSLSCLNLLGTKYAAMELSYASNFDPDAAPSRLPARHVMAGAPRTVLLTLEVLL
jgi:iron complex outermembrane recepter protein